MHLVGHFLAFLSLGGAPAGSFTPAAEERIVLVGDALVEREQRFGYLETALLARFPNRKLTFRNLGWSADTVAGLSRAYFDPPEKGTERLFEQLQSAQPTTLIVGYGMAESLIDPEGARTGRFRAGLAGFLDRARREAEKGKRIGQVILLAPIPHEDLGPPYPDPRAHNRALAEYADVIRSLADEQGLRFVDLFGRLSQRADRSALTTNGIHLSEAGYWRLALEVEAGLGLGAESIEAELSAQGDVVRTENTVARNVVARPDGIEFDLLDGRLPTPLAGIRADERRVPGWVSQRLSITALPPGRYELAIDGSPSARASAREWALGIELDSTPGQRQAEKLRALIQRKNRLYFESYRPQNITYLLGFRSYEQGQNAKEIEALAGLVAQAEAEIEAARQPQTHHYLLTRIAE